MKIDNSKKHRCTSSVHVSYNPAIIKDRENIAMEENRHVKIGTHGGELVAVKKNIDSTQIQHESNINLI